MNKLILLALLPTIALAQPKIPEVTIYGSSHVPVELPKVGSSTSLITAEEIEARGIKQISDALRALPGIHLNNSGGALAQLRIRGAEAKHALMIVDGVVFNDVGEGEAYIDQFPIADIERIEIIRGPQSGIYGSAANSGAILITTKSGKGFRKPQLNASLEYGSLQTHNLSLSAQGQVGKVYSATTIQSSRTNGYNFSLTGNEKDGSGNFNFTQKLGIDINEKFNVEGFFNHQQKGQQLDSQSYFGLSPLEDSELRKEGKSSMGRINATYKALEGKWTHHLSANYNLQNNKFFDFGTQTYASNGARYAMQYKNAYRFEAAGMKHTVVSGFDMKRENYKFTDYYNEWLDGKTRDQKGIFGEYLIDLNQGTTLSGALRQDLNSTFANILTYRLSAAHNFATATKLHGSFGKGSSNPTFIQQYGYQPSKFIGNAGIKPEQSLGYDIGLEQKWLGGKFITDITYYNLALSDAIVDQYLSLGFSTINNAQNILRRQGIEFAFSAIPLDNLTLNGSYTYFTGKDNKGLLPVRRPNHSASLNAAYRTLNDKGLLTVGLSYNGKMRDVAFNNDTYTNDTVGLHDFTILTAQFAYDINKNTTAYLRAENLLNQKYQEVYSYRGKPLEVFAGLRVKLQ